MVKTVLKEIIITLLMCFVILLLLAIMFYDYNPLNKVIPNRISYSTPNDIKSEIDEENMTNILDSSFNVVYSIDNSDLDKYKKSNRYVPGKEHPFYEIEESAGEKIPDGKVAEDVNAVDETPSTTNTNPDATDKVLNTTGKK